MAASTCSRFFSETGVEPVSTRDTVGKETPAAFATSRIVGGRSSLAIRISVSLRQWDGLEKTLIKTSCAMLPGLLRVVLIEV